MSTISDRIREIRKSTKLNQTEFGEKLGVTRSVIKNLELNLNKNGVPDNIIKLISMTFNVNENWLRTGNGEIFNKKSIDEEIESFIGSALSDKSDSFKRTFISVLSKLSPREWELILEFIDEIKNNKSNDTNNELSEKKELNKIPIYSKSAYEMTDEEINEEVEAYRQQLILEKTQPEKSLVSQKDELA